MSILTKVKAKYQIKEAPSEGGRKDTDFPYFHVSDHPETPVLLKKEIRHRDPEGIYLFYKGKQVDVDWTHKKYRWDVKLKPGRGR